MRRAVTIIVALLVVATVVVAGLGTWTVRRSFPEFNATVTMPDLADEVEVVRDEHGVAHVYASSVPDLFAAQGFVHAQDRFWEMDGRRHTTSGRLSELFGPDQVDTDKFLRTLSWRELAEQELDILADETVTVLSAYAAGVNAWMDGKDTSDMSLEYAVLGLQQPGYEPEPWEPADSVAWLKAMAWDLRSNVDDELDRALVADAVGVERATQLHPEYPFDRHPVIVEDGAVANETWDPDDRSGARLQLVGGQRRTHRRKPTTYPAGTARSALPHCDRRHLLGGVLTAQ